LDEAVRRLEKTLLNPCFEIIAKYEMADSVSGSGSSSRKVAEDEEQE
jgi:hypothetical protein